MVSLLNGKSWKNLGVAIGLSVCLINARGLGPMIGEFSIQPLKKSLAKASARQALGQTANRAQAIARLEKGFSSESLDPFGWSIINAYKGIATLEGDPETYGSIQNLPGILEITLSRNVSGTMEAARKLSRVDEVLKWGPRPSPGGVNGKGVLVGIVDFGFDTRHPAFLDSLGKTRFIAIWDPNLPSIKGSPFNRGQVKTGSQMDLDPGFGQNEGDEHGTDVASVAAGSDRSNPYYGVAPEASLIGVNLSSKKESADLEANVMNGISWIFHVADSLKMPAVVNLSLGNAHMGPHDGTSLFDRFIDSVTGPGHIVVGAMGNDGEKKLHAGFTLAKSIDTVGTFCPLPAAVDLWGEVGKPFKFQVLILDSITHSYQTSTAFLSTSNGTGQPMGDSIVWTNPTTKAKQGILLFVRVQRANSGNNKPHVEVTMLPVDKDTAQNTDVPMLGIRLLGTGNLQAWNATSKPFSSQGIPRFMDGDNKMTLSEIGGTAKSIISVGSYTSTNTFTDFTGKLQDNIVNQKVGELAAWSSLGPAGDGRIKPDLCAPGRVMVGALSSTLVNMAPWQNSRIVIWPDLANKTGRYWATEGTSLSAPLVAGVIALMLEKTPKLTPALIKEILAKTAYKDSFTGSLPIPDATWGAGKLDASAALFLSSGGAVSAKKPKALDRKPFAVFYGGHLQIEGIEFPDKLHASLSDWQGRWVSEISHIKGSRFYIQSKNYKTGIYFVRIEFDQARYVLPCFLESQ
jgi:minor extracellular serine protease Vpr